MFSFYDDEGSACHPHYVSKKKFKRSGELLYWDDHYAWIKSFNAFMVEQSARIKRFCCRRCFGHFWSEKVNKTHDLYCQGLDEPGQMFVHPEPWEKVRFQNIGFDFFFPLYSIFLMSFKT